MTDEVADGSLFSALVDHFTAQKISDDRRFTFVSKQQKQINQLSPEIVQEYRRMMELDPSTTQINRKDMFKNGFLQSEIVHGSKIWSSGASREITKGMSMTDVSIIFKGYYEVQRINSSRTRCSLFLFDITTPDEHIPIECNATNVVAEGDAFGPYVCPFWNYIIREIQDYDDPEMIRKSMTSHKLKQPIVVGKVYKIRFVSGIVRVLSLLPGNLVLVKDEFDPESIDFPEDNLTVVKQTSLTEVKFSRKRFGIIGCEINSNFESVKISLDDGSEWVSLSCLKNRRRCVGCWEDAYQVCPQYCGMRFCLDCWKKMYKSHLFQCDPVRCATCAAPCQNQCSACTEAYCNEECQKADWAQHKKSCA